MSSARCSMMNVCCHRQSVSILWLFIFGRNQDLIIPRSIPRMCIQISQQTDFHLHIDGFSDFQYEYITFKYNGHIPLHLLIQTLSKTHSLFSTPCPCKLFIILRNQWPICLYIGCPSTCIVCVIIAHSINLPFGTINAIVSRGNKTMLLVGHLIYLSLSCAFHVWQFCV